MDGPNPLAVALSISKTLLVTRRPSPQSDGTVSHAAFAPLLGRLADEGTRVLPALSHALSGYIDDMSGVEPDALSRAEALAYWLNLYNAGALRLAATAAERNLTSVLRVPGAFSRPLVTVAGEALSLDAIEHAKVRRFGDPRIHGALVCGSVSCPTLRHQPYSGRELDTELDQQMRAFLSGGGAVRSANELRLSRVFQWYGGDFVRPHRMPTWVPPRKRQLLSALGPWIDPGLAASTSLVAFQPYDWGLRCSVG